MIAFFVFLLVLLFFNLVVSSVLFLIFTIDEMDSDNAITDLEHLKIFLCIYFWPLTIPALLIRAIRKHRKDAFQLVKDFYAWTFKD